MARMSSAERREALVQAALRVIAERGVQGATTRAIVAEAGMPLASFHYAFDSRDEMMEELIAHVVDSQSVAAFSTLRFGSDIHSTVRAGLQAFFETVVADPGHEQVLFELMLFAMRTPGLAALPKRQWAKYYAAAEAILEAATEHTGVVWTRPIEEIALVLVNVMDGLTLAWLATRDLGAASTVMDAAADSIAALAIKATAIPTTAHTKDRSA